LEQIQDGRAAAAAVVEQTSENLSAVVTDSLAALFPERQKLNLPALVAVVFFTVSGGAFGIEPLVGKMGAGWAIVLILVTPVLWSLPIALMVSELSSAIPAEGGYYVWVKRALGNFWGVQEGWWTICFTAVDMAVYPVLFVNYLAFFLPVLRLDETGAAAPETFWIRWAAAIGIIVFALLINYLGARAVGNNAIVNILLVLLPFVLFVVYGLAAENNLSNGWAAINQSFAEFPSAGLIAVGLATVLWNYCAWDNVSTFAGEVQDAQKNYPRALLLTLPLTILAYLLPVWVGIGITTSEKVWNESAGFPFLAAQVAGNWLGIFVAAAALLSAWSLFNSQLLYVSRMPFVLAKDGWLPAWLGKSSSKTGVPINALFLSCAISAAFAALPFGKLVVIDILLYSAALSLEFVALLILRRREPDLLRPFKIPGGWFVLILLTAAPFAFAAVVLTATITSEDMGIWQINIVAVAMLSGILLYFARRKSVLGKSKND
jgi:amino acid transporter